MKPYIISLLSIVILYCILSWYTSTVFASSTNNTCNPNACSNSSVASDGNTYNDLAPNGWIHNYTQQGTSNSFNDDTQTPGLNTVPIQKHANFCCIDTPNDRMSCIVEKNGQCYVGKTGSGYSPSCTILYPNNPISCSIPMYKNMDLKMQVVDQGNVGVPNVHLKVSYEYGNNNGWNAVTTVTTDANGNAVLSGLTSGDKYAIAQVNNPGYIFAADTIGYSSERYMNTLWSCGTQLGDGNTNAPCTFNVTSAVTSFTLVNAQTNTDVATITNGSTVNMNNLPGSCLNIRANTTPPTTGSVVFDYDGTSNYHTENFSPYYIGGDNSGTPTCWTLTPGTHTLTATPYSNGVQGNALTVSFTVLPQVTSFTLVDAQTNTDVTTITNSATIDISNVQSNCVNIRANTNPATVGSVVFDYDGTSNYHTENSAPYYIGSDNSGNPSCWKLTTGSHTLTGTAFTAANGTGLSSTPLTVSFTATIPSYTISGFNFIDNNTDGKYQSGGPDAPYTQPGTTYSIVDGNGNKIITNAPFNTTDGSYTATVPHGGNYTVSYDTVPPGYYMTYPTGTPPTIGVTVGPGCKSTGTYSCDANNNISGINFGMINAPKWIQSFCADMRVDDGFTDPIPANPSCNGVSGQYASQKSLTYCPASPGIIYSGVKDADFGNANGQANINKWQTGGISSSKKEQFKPIHTGVIRTSYEYIISTLKQSGKTASPMPCPSEKNCDLSKQSITHGIYAANGDLTLTASDYTFPAGQGIIILVPGTLTIEGDLHVPDTSSVIFSAGKNITVDKSVTALEGLFSADNSFIVQGGGTCTDSQIAIAGSVVVNASLQSGQNKGTFQNNRDLCTKNLTCPTVTFTMRPDFLLNAPEFIKQVPTTWKELNP